ncbi:MAG: CDGP domain-containing protein [Mycobacterium sp.]
MSVKSSAGRLLATIGMCAMIAAGVSTAAMTTAPSLSAVPGDPTVGCETYPSGYICDGPIGTDNTFARCSISRPIVSSKRYLPPTKECWMVDLNDNPNFGFGLPQYHIDE